ncbi:MAG: CPBP family intramembrane metalloprotease [Leptolyngbya sp.]|nr:MAG: CPBP family intramembrane metalloprotease [Leptolyngbya sp.]
MLIQAVHRRSLLALILTVPLASFGALMSLIIAPGISGQSVVVLCQFWLLAFPIAWLLQVEQQTLKIPKPKRRDWLIGTGVGLLMFSIILSTYWLFAKDWINRTEVITKVQQLANVNQLSFLVACVYFALINALVEEYLWRWFVYRRCEQLISSQSAVFLSAVFFTLHHVIVLAYYFDWQVVTVGTIAVFCAGVIWAQCYRKYRSIWSSYLSHAIAVIAICIVAWQVLFG